MARKAISMDEFESEVRGENAATILGWTDRWLKEMGATQSIRDATRAQAKNGDYEHLIAFCGNQLRAFRDGTWPPDGTA